MKVSTWLVLELRPKNNWSGEVVPKIVGTRQTRPVNQLAVKVTLDIDPNALQPHIEAMVGAGILTLKLEPSQDQIDAIRVQAKALDTV